MITTELYNGQGLGNQLFCYITTRVIALDKGFEFGIQSPEKCKGTDFLTLDFGKELLGGIGPEGGPPRKLPNGIDYYYNERKITHPQNGSDIRIFDENLVNIPDMTKIDGLMQDEQYFKHRKKEIKKWLTVKKEFECFDFSHENICVINFRGGEYRYFQDLFLPKKYWDRAIQKMLEFNSKMKFVVITDDVVVAKKFFPDYPIHHFSIGKDYSILKNAQYLILSNSSFAWFPAWTSEKVKKCIAPKYWARHNINDGFWSCMYNCTEGWLYLDRTGDFFDSETCQNEIEKTIQNNSELFTQKKITNNFLVVSNYYNDLSWIPEYTKKYVVYDQSDNSVFPPKLQPRQVIKSPHLGHNIRDYCTFIIDNYETLPDRTIFATGNIFPRHVSREYFTSIMNTEYFTPIEDVSKHKEEWPISFFSSDGGFCELNNSWYLDLESFHPIKYFFNYNDFLKFCFVSPVIPKYIRFSLGANYIVPKEQILKYPKVFYENLRVFVSHCKTAIPGESYILERAFHTIWTSNFVLHENMKKPISKKFRPVPKGPRTFTKKLVRQSMDSFVTTTRFSQRIKTFIQFKMRKESNDYI